MKKIVVAWLADKFHLSMEQIGNLTDRQIVEYYCHKRDKDGNLQEQQAKGMNPLHSLDIAAHALQLSLEERERLREELIKKHGDTHSASSEPTR